MKNHKEKQTHKTRSRAWYFVAALVSTVVLAVIVGISVSSKTANAQQEKEQTRSQAEDGDTTVQYANQKIKIDPQTGKLRTPTVEEARSIVETIQSLTNRSSKGLKVTQTAGGGTKVDLQGRYQTVVVAKPNPDGTNEIMCVNSLEEAAAFLGIDPSKIPAKDK
jgi:hypothetical protein